MELVTENGNTITEFTKDGLTFVEGRKGSEYKIKITNGTWTKIKVVISVDGLDIMTGKRATPNAGGYVLNAYETQFIEGWRISNDEVRKFFFTNQKNSYNAKTGNDTNNLGVIGIIGYKLLVQPILNTYYHNTLNSGKYYIGGVCETFSIGDPSIMDTMTLGSLSAPTNMIMGSTASLSKGAQSEVRARDIAPVGTGMGKVETSKVVQVNDTFETAPYASLMIYYKSRKELESMGIIVAPTKNKPLPQAFAGFCKQV